MPVAVIGVYDVRVVGLAELDIATAKAESEGFVSDEEWRVADEAFWNRDAEELRSRLADPSWRLVDDTPVVVERFRMVDRLTT